MIERWHFLSGEYPPVQGGIAQFARIAAEALAGRGAEVHVWTSSSDQADAPAGVTVHQLPDRFGVRSMAALEHGTRVKPGRVVLHYTPNALGCRGANLRFCQWFAVQGRGSWDARVLFHEPFLYFGRQVLARNALALMHRVMAAALLRTNDEVYLSTPSWQPLLERYSTRAHEWTWIPITAGSPPRASVKAADSARSRLDRGARWLVGTFGTYARETAEITRLAIDSTLAACPDAHVICLGRNSREFVSSLADRARVSATGELSDEELSAAIAACDVMLQPFPEGVTCRRTSLLRTLVLGAPVITTTGRYTESIWPSSGAVALAPADDPAAIGRTTLALLADAPARARLRESARRLYDSSFSPAALVEALDPPEHVQKVLVGTHTFASSGAGALRQQTAVESLSALRCAHVVSLEHGESQMAPRVSGVEYLPVLRRDSVRVTRTPGPRKAIASEVFGELAERAIAYRSRYFLYANGDIQISQTVIDRVLRGDRLAYLFWRTDTGDGSNSSLMPEGIDVFAIDARWYKANSWRFRPYIIGDRTWDNVYAAILGAEANAVFIAEPGWVRHERHEREWQDSPFQPYLQYLSALDHQYFALWCRFWDRAREAVHRGASTDIDIIASEAFNRPLRRRVDRAVQWGRNAKALVRYHIARS